MNSKIKSWRLDTIKLSHLIKIIFLHNKFFNFKAISFISSRDNWLQCLISMWRQRVLIYTLLRSRFHHASGLIKFLFSLSLFRDIIDFWGSLLLGPRMGVELLRTIDNINNAARSGVKDVVVVHLISS